MRKAVSISILLLALAGPAIAETVKYTYDAAGRLTRVEYGNGRGYVYRYDANGNLLARESLRTRERPARRAARRSNSAVKG